MKCGSVWIYSRVHPFNKRTIQNYFGILYLKGLKQSFKNLKLTLQNEQITVDQRIIFYSTYIL